MKAFTFLLLAPSLFLIFTAGTSEDAKAADQAPVQFHSIKEVVEVLPHFSVSEFTSIGESRQCKD